MRKPIKHDRTRRMVKLQKNIGKNGKSRRDENKNVEEKEFHCLSAEKIVYSENHICLK